MTGSLVVVVVVDLGVAEGEDDGAARAEDAAPREAISGATGGTWPWGWVAYRGWFCVRAWGVVDWGEGRDASSFEVVVIDECRGKIN